MLLLTFCLIVYFLEQVGKEKPQDWIDLSTWKKYKSQIRNLEEALLKWGLQSTLQDHGAGFHHYLNKSPWTIAMGCREFFPRWFEMIIRTRPERMFPLSEPLLNRKRNRQCLMAEDEGWNIPQSQVDPEFEAMLDDFFLVSKPCSKEEKKKPFRLVKFARPGGEVYGGHSRLGSGQIKRQKR
jgi:hypothetical protein